MASGKRRQPASSTGWRAAISISGRASCPGLPADQALTEQIARLFAAANAQVAPCCRLPKELRMPQPRLGPRPLPLHLGTALMTWASSESAWQLWKRDSPSSKPGSTAR